MSTTNILIVEDESIIALDIQNSLINAGYVIVAIATCAEEALDLTAQYVPNLVLMDVRLRGEIDGVETAEKIRREFNLPVVYLTAHADENTLQRAKITEPFGYILKPFEDRELITTIEIALSRHKAEGAIRLALEKEKELNQFKSRFISVVSHEFRNPLNAILFSAELLERYDSKLSTERKHGYLQRIKISVRRMSQLLNDVLTIGETESGNLPFDPQPIDLLQFCKDIIDELQLNQALHCSIQFSHNHTNFLPLENSSFPCLDEKLLRHILTNLLSNAVKYSPQGKNVELNLIYSNKDVVFRVQDCGIGIPISDRSRLFDSFYRASNVKTIPGTGLGLSIVKQCVDLHGGTIEVISEVEIGTTFIVTLPLKHYPLTYEENFSH